MDVSSIASAMLSISQSQTQSQISTSMLKMDAQAQQALADMIMQNALLIEAQSHAASGGFIDIFT